MSRILKDSDVVVDATKSFTFKVLARDSKKGVIGSATQCAMAQSLKRQGIALRVAILRTICYIEQTPGIFTRYMISPEDSRMTEAFDTLNYFRPGTYTLLPPRPSAHLGARKGEKNGTNKRSGTKGSISDRAQRLPLYPA